MIGLDTNVVVRYLVQDGCDHTVTFDPRAARDGAIQLLGPGDGTPDS